MPNKYKCKQSHVTFLNSKCDMPPYVVGPDGTYLCKHHAMEEFIEYAHKNKKVVLRRNN